MIAMRHLPSLVRLGSAIAVVAALFLILWLLPETKGRELEETARV